MTNPSGPAAILVFDMFYKLLDSPHARRNLAWRIGQPLMRQTRSGWPECFVTIDGRRYHLRDDEVEPITDTTESALVGLIFS